MRPRAGRLGGAIPNVEPAGRNPRIPSHSLDGSAHWASVNLLQFRDWRVSDGGLNGKACPQLVLDPSVRPSQAVLETDLWFPAQDLPQLCVVRIAAPNSLRSAHVLDDDLHSRDTCHHLHQLVDGYHPVLAQIQRLGPIG